MDDYCAPQWADFTCSPQLYSDSYFEIEHEAHKPQNLLKPTACKVIIPSKVDSVGEKTIYDTTFECNTQETKTAGIEKAFFVPFNKDPPIEEAIIDDVLNNVMTKLKLGEQSRKLEDAWNISIEELTKRRTKLPPIAERLKASTAIKAKKTAALLESKKTILADSAKEKKRLQSSSSTKNKNELLEKNLLEKLDTDAKDTKADPMIKELSSEMFPIYQKIDKIIPEKTSKQPKVLTCQYRRRSIIKYRRRSNQFISLAEAINKFQNETPQRFRTISNKDLKPGPLMKLKRAPLKLTFPISPALRCKQRVREQKHGLESNEIKGNQIKAKPVPVNILKAPSSLKKVPKKPATVIEEFNLTKSTKSRSTINSGSQQYLDNKERDGKDTNTHGTAVKMSNTSLKKENNGSTEHLSGNNVKPTTRASSVAFEIRNKEFQTKKDQKLKNLQGNSQVKIEFHARPAPNFSKTVTSVKEPNIKRAIVPRPFSFEERNKNLAKKKELAKQTQEDNKKLRVFHANPAPSFKSANAKEDNKKCKGQELDNVKGLGIRKTRSFVNQENKEPNVMKNTSMCLDTKDRRGRRSVMPNRLETKEFTDTVNNRKENIKTDQHKLNKSRTVVVELNTDKRAKARSEFDDRLKKKEKEEEEKRQREEENNLAREKMEVAELRKQAEVKARPMPTYKPMVILKSTKPPTSPRSPALGYKHKFKCAL